MNTLEMQNGNLKIKNIKAREILDSRGNPTVEVELETEEGIFVASVPSGASTGKYEAVELRDGGERYRGKGVLKAIKNIQGVIFPAIKNKDVSNQKEIDELMIELDGTPNKSRLGANAILPVSMAVCRAGATATNLPLYQYITQIFNSGSKFQVPSFKIPVPSFNIINGGAHAGNDLDIQEFMVLPQQESFLENLRVGSEIYHILKEIVEKKYGEEAMNVGDEGGFAPPVSDTKEVLDLIIKAIKDYPKTKIGLDCAASQFFQDKKYHLEKKVFNSKELSFFYCELVKAYPIILLEDPFAEDDWEGWQKLISNFQFLISKPLVIGDDLTVTNPKRIKEAQEKKACNGLLLKINQIGTISEAIEAGKLARFFEWKVMVSHRSGETNDDFIADLAVGIGADFIKSGAPARGERVAKYNRLLKIEEDFRSAD